MGEMTRMSQLGVWALLTAAASVVIALGYCGAVAAEMDDDPLIEGEIALAPDLAHHFEPGDRLIIKLFRPGDDVELDVRYQIVDAPALPMTFQIGPAMDMNRRAKWDAYVVEVFTDKDNDILSIADGELAGRSPDIVPLGTKNLSIQLGDKR